MTDGFKSGFAAVVGRPSVGKSTLVNALTSHKVSIVGRFPQTTRGAIRGILNRDNSQIIFVDTPGFHKSEKHFNKTLCDVAIQALNECDVIIYVFDVQRAPGIEEEEISAVITKSLNKNNNVPLFICINKIDAKESNTALFYEYINKTFPELQKERIFEISAREKTNLECFIDALIGVLPLGPAWYPKDYYTDQTPDFRIAEILREAASSLLKEELPHALSVSVDEMKLDKTKNILYANAIIAVEKESQKGIVIGKDGKTLGLIRKRAMRELKEIFDWTIKLDITVKHLR